jgi:hypothetical protein
VKDIASLPVRKHYGCFASATTAQLLWDVGQDPCSASHFLLPP